MAEDEARKRPEEFIPAIMELAPHVGVLVIAFSTIDVHLARLLSYIHPRCAADGVVLKFPRDLTPKLGQVSRAFGECQSLRPWKAEMLRAVKEIEAVKPTRDLLSHGALAIPSVHMSELYFSKVNPLPSEPHIQEEEVLRISPEDLRSEAQRVLLVAAKLLSIVASIMDADQNPT